MIYPLDDKVTALLVVDVQHEYFDEHGPAFVEAAAAKLPNINRLIDAVAAAGQHVVYVRHVFRADGSDVGRMGDFEPDDAEGSFIEGTRGVALVDGLHVIDGSPEVVKNRYDSFTNTDLRTILDERGVTTVVVVGFMTSFCCDSTTRAAHALDYEVIFVPDAIDGPDLQRTDGSPYPHDEVLADVTAQLAAGFAEIATVDDLVGRLAHATGT